MLLILILLIVGVVSLLERVLLAVIQYRQGPITILLYGLGQVLADGIKIYSKYSLDVLIWAAGLVLIGLTFTSLVGLSMLIFSSAMLTCISAELDLIVYFLVIGYTGLLLFLPVITAPSIFIAAGVIRQLRATLLAELILESCIPIIASLCIIIDSSADNSATRIVYMIPFIICGTVILPAAMLITGRAPFDLPEAESELVAGVSTELGGYTFSLLLLIDYIEFMMWSTLLCIICSLLSLSSAGVVLIIVLAYVGRILICRILLTAVVPLVFLVLLWIIVIMYC